MWLQFRVLVLITLITIIHYFDRNAIAFAIQPIEQTLGLTNLEFGWVASAFGLGYIVTSCVGNAFVRQFSPIWVWPISAVIWSTVTMGMGMVKEYHSLVVLRVILGFTEGIHLPCLLKIIADWLPANLHRRSLSMGLFGVPVASIIGSPFISWLIEMFGWHKMFFILGILGWVWAIMWIMCFRRQVQPVREQIFVAGENTLLLEGERPWKQILSSQSFQISCFIYFVFGYITFFMLMWLPGYLEQTYTMDIRSTGYLVMFPWFAGLIGLFCGGALSHRLLQMTHDLRKSRSYTIGIGIGLSGIAFLGVTFMPPLIINLLLISIGAACAFVVNIPIDALNHDLFRNHAGTAQAIMGFFFAFAGIVAPVSTGWLVEISGDFQIAIGLVSSLSIVAAILAIFIQHPELKKRSTMH